MGLNGYIEGLFVIYRDITESVATLYRMPVDRRLEHKIRRAKASGLSYPALAREMNIGIGIVYSVFRKDRAGERRRGKCEKCGQECRFRVRHHTDYLKGTVILVCPNCHSHPGDDLLRVRLKPREFQKLDSLLDNNTSGASNRPEMVRLLIHREFNRHHNLPKPKPCDWQSAFRTGRPAK